MNCGCVVNVLLKFKKKILKRILKKINNNPVGVVDSDPNLLQIKD